MAIVKYKNQSGIEYAYESTSSWDPVRKQSRPKRKYLGRVDPETGEIIPTAGKRGRPRKNQGEKKEEGVLREVLPANANCAEEKEISSLRQENQRLRDENQRLRELISSIGNLLEQNNF